MMLSTPVCSYPIIVTHLSFNSLCLLLLYSIYLNGISCTLTLGSGEGEGEVNQREGERGNSSQSWAENTNMTDLYTVKKAFLF
jgi:hypothetical protein